MRDEEEKEEKIKKKNMKKIRRTLKARISVMDGRIHFKFGMRGALDSTAKMVNFRPAIIELRMRENGIFLVPVKCTLACRVPALAVLSCMTHHCVS